MIVGAVFAFLQVAGSLGASDSPPDLQHVSLTRWVLFLTLGSTAAGAIAGLLRPLANRASGAALVGIVAAIPMSVAADIFIFPASPGSPENLIESAFSCVVLGTFCGISMRWAYRRYRPRRKNGTTDSLRR
jgi:hypothetical protein